MEKLAVIGAGVMGSAIVTGIVKNKVLEAERIWLSDVDQAKTQAVCAKLGTKCAASNEEAVSGADAVLIAVKPQFLESAFCTIRGHLRPDLLLMSIVAGVPVERYISALNVERVLRIMPNTPAQVGEGVCGWYATDAVNTEQKQFAEKVLSALGVHHEVAKESDLDLFTAVSGSGPAYVYLFIESMTDAAVQMGLPRVLAQQIVLQTVMGSAVYMKNSGKHPVILKNEVTSPGGTTAAALAAMEKEGFRTAVTEGMLACLKKSLELGGK